MTPDRAYSSPEVVKLTGVSYRQLDYWDRTSLVSPSIAESAGSGTQRRYSREDVERIRATRKLLDAGLSLQAVRRIIEAPDPVVALLAIARVVEAAFDRVAIPA